MDVSFNADEVFELAEQIERNGATYYRRAAELFPEAKLSDLLKSLALMEDQHERTFAALRRKVVDAPEWSDLDEMATAYLRSLVGSKVFDVNRPVADFFGGDETPVEILETAIALEKESIVFYVGIKELIPASLGRDSIDAILREEMKHVVTLTDQLERQKKK